ncbi:large-conductance mechanosensitive channel protein MscL [Mangrovimonas aestuarii]|uniref:large-conductance mechanosensitive channel protein MscL n=1 Tax=Mangrovimonas aestuarii TaxID=3018443 RepID=UPI0023793C1D|nr:large-conductance mechanosensitive channel protein MscL [Mangrovimonas aestuarii]
MGFFKDFKSFLMKGDIINLATAVIIGGAFGKIVTSFTKDILMPPIGVLLGDVNFTDLKLVLKEATTNAAGEAVPAVTINYGSFVQVIIDFIIIGFCIFMVLKAYEKSKKKEEEAPAPPSGPTQEELLTEIRDLLKK